MLVLLGSKVTSLDNNEAFFFFLLFWSIFCSVGVLGSFVRDSRLVKRRYFLSLPRKDSITVGQLAGFQMPSSRRSQARWRTIAMMRFACVRHVSALGGVMQTRVQPTIRGLSLSVMSTAVSQYDRHMADIASTSWQCRLHSYCAFPLSFLRPSTCWGRVILVLTTSQSHLLC